MQFYHLARKAGALIVSIILVKIGLSLEEIGIFETWIYLLMLFSFFWVESLIKAYLSVYPDKKEWGTSSGGATIYLLFVALSLGLGGLFLLLKTGMLTLATGSSNLEFFNTFIVYLILIPPTMLIPFIYQIRKNITGIISYSIFVLVGYIIAVVVPLILGKGLLGVGQGLVVYALVANIWALISFVLPGIRKHGVFKELARTVLHFGWPLMLYAVVQSMTTLVDAGLVQWFFKDKSSFAIFRYGARELPLVVPLVVGVVNLVIPLLVSQWDEGLDLLKSESIKLMHLLFPLSIVLMLVSPILFELVYSSDFVRSAEIFNIYLLLIIPQLLFPQTLIIAKRKNRSLFLVGLFEVVVNITFSLILIQYAGMEGVAAATVIAFCLEKLILILYLDKSLKYGFGEYTEWKPWLIYSSITIVAFVLAQIIY